MAKYVIEFDDVANENDGMISVGIKAECVSGDPYGSLAAYYGDAMANMVQATLSAISNKAVDYSDDIEGYDKLVTEGVKADGNGLAVGVLH